MGIFRLVNSTLVMPNRSRSLPSWFSVKESKDLESKGNNCLLFSTRASYGFFVAFGGVETVVQPDDGSIN
ncbi:hypothetical protein SLEP1_g3219 [Rubroshorea leprosula]|uniref:Uncharacterized protein n=1 Tax=Rubroshorea leprosula TaxID=152421 RepID=A0AAV5HU19_9ROSI|nr:hypothetical protein SLEP1_g3219 [Rubroshorea leprosula]